MKIRLATCLSVGVYVDAITRVRKYEVLAHDSEKRQIRIRGDNNRSRWFHEGYFDLAGADAPYVESIWIEAEEWPIEDYEPRSECTDVAVVLSNRKRYVSTFYTLRKLSWILEKNRETGEDLSGKYIWAADMIIVDEISRKRIEEVVQHMLHEDELKDAWELDESGDPPEPGRQQGDSAK